MADGGPSTKRFWGRACGKETEDMQTEMIQREIRENRTPNYGKWHPN